MTRKELSIKVSLRTGLDIGVVDTIIRVSNEEIVTTLKKGDAVYLRGFGTFKVAQRNAKKVQDITRKNTFTMPAHKVAKWKPSEKIKVILNN